jgi:hypothetical protein
MIIRKINNVPQNIKALVVGQATEKKESLAPFIFVALMIGGTVLINYKYATGKI